MYTKVSFTWGREGEGANGQYIRGYVEHRRLCKFGHISIINDLRMISVEKKFSLYKVESEAILTTNSKLL